MKDLMVKQFLWHGLQINVVMKRKMNGFIQKEKDKLEMGNCVRLRKVDMREIMMYKVVKKIDSDMDGGISLEG